MVKRHSKHEDGKYHIDGKKFEQLEGSRAQVHHGTAHHTPGGLTKRHIMMNKRGRLVSKKKHASAKRMKRLEKAGYFTKKGHFGAIKKEEGRKTRKHHSRK